MMVAKLLEKYLEARYTIHFSEVSQCKLIRNQECHSLVNETKGVISGSHLPETIRATASSITSLCNDFVF